MKRDHRPIPRKAYGQGRLVTSPSGDARFIPSHDMGGDSRIFLNAMTSSHPAPGFPFFSEQQIPVIDELLDMLPPLPHLEELKSGFFVVFSLIVPCST